MSQELLIPQYSLDKLSYTDVEILQSALQTYMERMKALSDEDITLSHNEVLEALELAPKEDNPVVDLKYALAAQFAEAKTLFDKLTNLVGHCTTEG